jgi:hypothetical protein
VTHEKELEQARQHLARVDAIIAAQENRVDELRLAGDDVAIAEAFLRVPALTLIQQPEPT